MKLPVPGDGSRLEFDDSGGTVVAYAGLTCLQRVAYCSSMTDDSRELGVDLSDVEEDLENLDYPIEQDELLEEYGDEEVDMGEESATLEELLEPLNEDEYGSYDEVEQAIMNMVGDDAIGRKNYSDRTPPAAGEQRQEEGGPDQDGQSEQESF